MLDWASQDKMDGPSKIFWKGHPNDYKTNDFGLEIIGANFHTCFVPLTNVYKPSLSIFNFTLKLITCSMLPLFTGSVLPLSMLQFFFEK